MTDAELIAVLKIKDCQWSSGARNTCWIHDSLWVNTVRCEHVMAMLDGARAGIDLARSGVAAMITMYVTFGSRYHWEEHSRLPQWASDPDGFLEVRANDEEHALTLLRKYVGTVNDNKHTIECACIYPADDWQPYWFPNGCKGWIDHDGLHRAQRTAMQAYTWGATMPSDALNRACEAAWGHEANISDFPAYPSRGSIAAALRVMADDLSAALQHDAESILADRGYADGRTHHDECWRFHADCALLRAAALAKGWADD